MYNLMIKFTTRHAVLVVLNKFFFVSYFTDYHNLLTFQVKTHYIIKLIYS